MVLVNGMGGIGKTTLAQVYLSKHYDEYQYILWLGLNTEEVNFEADFIRAEGLLARLDINPNGKSIRQSFTELIAALKELDGRPCLLVIDNASNKLANYYDYLPSQPNWHILATSREQIPYFDLKELGFLEEEDAVKLFELHYTRKKLDPVFLVELVKDLEYHTLTIEILAKTAQEQRSAPSDLLNAIQNDLEVDLEGVRHSKDKVLKLTSYLCSIFKTSQLSTQEKWLLQQFICLPAEFHPYDLLKNLILVEESLAFNLAKTLDSLAKKGWLLYNKEADSYKIHRIIMDVVKTTLGLEEGDVELLIKTITSKLLIDQTKDNPIDKFKWVPLGQAIIVQFEVSHSQEVSTLQNNLAIVLREFGDYQGARILLEKAKISDEKNFGKDHPSTARTYSNLALILQVLGEYQDARILLEKATLSDEKNFGENDSSTIVRYSNLATVLQSLGDYNTAKTLLEKVKVFTEKKYGEDHPSTAISYSNLALVLRDLKRYEEAQTLLEKVKASDEKNFGKDHPSTSRTYSNLALILQNLEDYNTAKILLEKATLSDEKNFGKDHPVTAIRYSNLAVVLQDLGDFKTAKILLEKAKISAEKNISTAISYSNLALVLQDLEDFEAAKILLEKAYRILKKHLKENHPNTRIIKNNLDDVISLMNK